VADLERHIPMAERLGNDPGDAGRMARSFLAAMRENTALRARLAEVERAHEMTRRELQRYQSHVHDADGFTAQAAQRALDATARAEAAEAKLAAVEAERDRWIETARQFCQNADYWRERAEAAEAERDQVTYDRDCAREAGLVYQRQYHEVKATLARVEALCDEHDHAVVGHCWRAVEKIRAAIRGPQDERHEFRPGPFECAHHTGGMNCGLPPDDPIHRGPQDEEAAEICGANGCSNRATGMRKSYVPGWPDVPDCGMHPQRSGIARPEPAECDAEDDWCFTHDRKHFRCYTAGGTARPAEECPHPDWSFDRTICVGCDSMPDICVECGWHDCRPLWSDLCAGAKGYENEPDCGVCWGCQRADQTQEGDR
jgi:hypothetical protein